MVVLGQGGQFSTSEISKPFWKNAKNIKYSIFQIIDLLQNLESRFYLRVLFPQTFHGMSSDLCCKRALMPVTLIGEYAAFLMNGAHNPEEAHTLSLPLIVNTVLARCHRMFS